MKKSAWIALAILAVLAGLFFVIREEPKKTVATPWSIDAVKKMTRVEISQPGDDGGELIVFEKSDDGWKMTRPVESELTKATTEKLVGLFAKEIRTDDLRLDTNKAKAYGLDETSAVKVSAYSAGSDTAAVELEVGNAVRIEETGVERTYVRKPDQKRIYRAQFAIGDFVRKAPDEHRSKEVVGLDKADLKKVTIERKDAPKLVIARDGDAWKLVEPKVEEAVDESKVERIASTLGWLRASGFADDKTPEAVGLAPAEVSVTIETSEDNKHILLFGTESPDKKVYARFDDGVIFTVGKSRAETFRPTVDSLLKKEEKASKTQDTKTATN